MKGVFNSIGILLLLGVLLMIFWIAGMSLGIQLFSSNMFNGSSDSNGSLWIMLLISILMAGSFLYFIRHTTLTSWRLILVIFLLGFGLMSFLSQIETLWFNDSLKIPLNGVYGIIAGGAITFILFAPAATWITGKFRSPTSPRLSKKITFKSFGVRVLVLSILIWPFLYIITGYYVAWQFEEVRVFYTGSVVKEPFRVMLIDYFESNLYFFQIFRGFVWVLLAMLVLKYFQGTSAQKALALVLFFVFISCLGLLLPNPFMPDMVRMGHFIETSLENGILGILILLMLDKPSTINKPVFTSVSQ